MTKTQKLLFPLGAVLVGLLVAVTTPRGPKVASPESQRAIPAEANRVEKRAAPDAPSAPTLEGTVLETISVPNYVYLRLATSDGTEQWAAVNEAEIRVGQRVQVRDAQLMEKFTSNTLKRTFERIYFGALVSPGDQSKDTAAGATPNPHVASDATAADASNLHGMPGANPHADPTAMGDNVAVGQISKASGPQGKTIAQVFAEAPRLTGKVVRVRGVVVKSTPKVMGRTFLHLRDGSGSKTAEDFDLAVTTPALPAVGTTVLLEGTVKTNVDFGSGYRYRVLLEDAREVTD
jgi:hypothetical protein